MNLLIAYRDQLLAKLIAAQELRESDSLAWIERERHVMLGVTNSLRAEAGLPPVSVEVIMRAETHASGHTDYTTKFALYCAEIALNDVRWIR